MRYLPSSSFMQMSMTQRKMPQQLSMLSAICCANSPGLNCCMPRITWRVESLTVARDTYLSQDTGKLLAFVKRLVINHVVVMNGKYMTCWGLWHSRGDANPNLMVSEPASMEATVHLASLQLLFFNSVASTAPRWLSSLLRQSIPPDSCKPQGTHAGHTDTRDL